MIPISVVYRSHLLKQVSGFWITVFLFLLPVGLQFFGIHCGERQ